MALKGVRRLEHERDAAVRYSAWLATLNPASTFGECASHDFLINDNVPHHHPFDELRVQLRLRKSRRHTLTRLHGATG
jgi:hypothetical protein